MRVTVLGLIVIAGLTALVLPVFLGLEPKKQVENSGGWQF